MPADQNVIHVLSVMESMREGKKPKKNQKTTLDPYICTRPEEILFI